MRRFIVNKGTKLIISKQYDKTPLNVERLKCTRLFQFGEDRSITISYIQEIHQGFKPVEVREYLLWICNRF